MNNLNIILLSIFLLSQLIQGEKEKFFRKDYTYIEATKSFYKIHTIAKPWLEAKKTCALEGATFYYPEDETEFNAVNTFSNESQSLNWISIGVSSLLAKGIFETVDGRLLMDVYNNWYKGEPNNVGGKEDCVVLNMKDGKMNDDDCTRNQFYICKKTLASLEWNVLCDIPNPDYRYNSALGRCYKLYSTPTTWSEAYRICRKDQSYLAVVNSDEESAYLVNIAQSLPKASVNLKESDSAFFLGYHNKYKDGWTTVNGYSIDDSGYTKWESMSTDSKVEELCGAMNSNGRLRPIDCNSRAIFICEHETTRAHHQSNIEYIINTQ